VNLTEKWQIDLLFV